MTHLSSIPCQNAFAPIAPMSPAAGPAPVTPSPAPRPVAGPEQPRSERAQRWAKQIEEAREEELRQLESALSHDQPKPAQIDDQKGQAATTAPLIEPDEETQYWQSVIDHRVATRKAKEAEFMGKPVEPIPTIRWPQTGPTVSNPCTPATPGGGHPDFPALPNTTAPAPPLLPRVWPSQTTTGTHETDPTSTGQVPIPADITLPSSAAFGRGEEDGGSDDDDYIMVRTKKRKRNGTTANTNAVASSSTARPPSNTLSTGAPTQTAVRAISRTLTAQAGLRFQPLPPSIPARNLDSCNSTPCPAGGFPYVQSDCPQHQFKNVLPGAQEDWMACGEPKMLAQVFGTNACGDPRHVSDISAYLRQGLEAVTGESNFRVSPPVAETPPATSNDPPYHYLVTNPNAATILALIKDRIHSLENPPITFECTAIDLNSPYLICTVRGFSSTITKEAATGIIDTHLRNGTIRSLVEQQELEANGDIDTDIVNRTVVDIMNTLTVEVLPYKRAGGALSPLVNVYLYTTAASASEWYKWRNAVAATVFTSFHDGTGTGTQPPLCTFCHGMGHPTGLCPFESIPQWHGALGRQNIERIRADGAPPRGRGGRNAQRGRGNTARRG